MNEALGKIHFWPTLVCMNVIFFPMMIQGLAGVSRRLYDAGATYAHAQGTLGLNVWISWAAWIMGLVQFVFIFNLFWSLFKGKRVESDNPWEATTLEWATPTPPPHGNFTVIPEVYRDPYDYSVPGATKDFTMQNQREVS
jgi:cytochrome c oxidase subunit 1